MILKYEIAMILLALTIGVIIYSMFKIMDIYEHRNIEGRVMLISIITIIALLGSHVHTYIGGDVNITNATTVAPKASSVLPTSLTRVPENRSKININENTNNVKNIQSINQYNEIFEKTLIKEFDTFDNEYHNTIILTDADRTTIGENAHRIQYKKLTDIDKNNLENLGIDDEFIKMMTNINYENIIFIIANSNDIHNEDFGIFLFRSSDPTIYDQHPYWNVPIRKNK